MLRNVITLAAFAALSLAAPADEIFARQSNIDCKGSSRCSNSQDFRNQCQDAFNKVEDTTYTSGGEYVYLFKYPCGELFVDFIYSKSGTCSGTCGLFVQGDGCSVSGLELKEGYDSVRSQCLACGSVRNFDGCLITVNYVSGCAA